MGHQAADEVNVAREPVELGDRHRASLPAAIGQSGGELRTPVEGVGALAGLDLDVFPADLETLGFGKASQRMPLGLYAQSRAPLLGGADADVAD